MRSTSRRHSERVEGSGTSGRLRLLAALRAAGAALLTLAAAAHGGAIDLGSRLEMFVDGHLIESVYGDASMRLNLPVKREVVLTTDKPWESATSTYFTVFRDGDRVRMYYRGAASDGDRPDQFTCYAESRDGVHFERPNLGLYEFNGSKENNICYVGAESSAFAPFKDENPNAKPDERYKAVCYRVVNKTGTVFAMASPDGLRWRRMSEEPVLPPGTFDSLNTAHWDPAIGKYRLFGRYWTGAGWTGFRGIQSSLSDDCLHWEKPRANEYADGVPLEHFYTNAVTRAPGVPHVLLSFPMRFVPERTKVPEHKHRGVSDAVFMASRDGVRWDRTFRESWVRPGQDQRNWTERSNMPAWGIVETSPDEWSMYVSEHYRWPDNRLRRVTVPRGRFASVRGGVAGGGVVTKGVTFAGKRLVLNYATSAAGEVRVEVLGEDGTVLGASEPLFGDELDGVVSWRGGFELAKLTGQAVRVRFVVNDADVYAFRFAE
jgi:hypothetical protein